MSLYNNLFGTNPLSHILKEVLKLESTYPIGRFRDIFYDRKNEKIILYTRNGGGNREHWENYDKKKSGLDCNCPGCIMTHQLPKHPHYICDYDDDFDNTYAYVDFSVPKEYKTLLHMSVDVPIVKIGDKFKQITKEMSSMTKKEIETDPRFEKTRELINDIYREVNNEEKGPHFFQI